MNLDKTPSRARRSSVELEEDHLWISFYKRIANDHDLATEVLQQLDADPHMKRQHLALYVCCRTAVQRHKEAQARNRRIGQSVRQMLMAVHSVLLQSWPQSVGRGLSNAGAIAAACLPQKPEEPAIAQVNRLTQDTDMAQAHVEFDQQPLETLVRPVTPVAKARTPHPLASSQKAA